MLENFKKTKYLLFGLIALITLVKIIYISYPQLTTDEARIAFRGYTLAKEGKDELGRRMPLLFNSSADYQLPTTSYLTALGIGIFGKSEIGARTPFIFLSVGISILFFLISKSFSKDPKFWILSTFILSLSYSFIFISKIPNELLILVFLLLLLFYLLSAKTYSKFSTLLIFLSIIASMFTSKHAWFVLTPFVSSTLYFYRKDLNLKTKLQIVGLTFFSCIVAFVIFLNIPQSKRSIMENNLSLLSNVSIENGINKLRGQGLEQGWPNFVEKILFNKAHFLVDGLLHWISQLQPNTYFGQLDEKGLLNFSQKGAFSKFLIIPFLSGLVYLIRKGKNNEKAILVYFLVLTFPAILIYPTLSPDLIILTVPYAALIITFGFTQFNKKVSSVILLFFLLELSISLTGISLEKKHTSSLRPIWVKEITKNIYQQSLEYQTAISDDISEDIINFIEWYNPIEYSSLGLNIPYPYKFNQTAVKNIKVIGSDNQIYICKDKSYKNIIISNRDKERLKDIEIKINRTYKNDLGQDAAYLLENDLCIK